MKVTYIYHSCFVLEDNEITVIIDYFKDTEGYKEGLLHSYFLNRPGKIYVLATHFHPDHFSKQVLEWREARPDIVYIFSRDILKHRRATEEDAIYLRRFEGYQDEIIHVQAYGSTDVGVSFYLEIEGKKIFHAGDLNNWHWNEESTPSESRGYEKSYLNELRRIHADVQFLDLAMFPVDPRLGKDYMRGAEQFVDTIMVNSFLPMHFDEEYEKANAFKTYSEDKGVRFIELHEKGQTIEF